MPAYGGNLSETTAILTYIYQDYVTGDEYPDIAKAMEEIAIAITNCSGS